MFKLSSQLTRCYNHNLRCRIFGSQFSSIQTSVLSNGVRVATEESHSPLACVSLFVEAGSVNETSDNNGITHFIERIAYKGFHSMDKSQLMDTLANIGARINVFTTREYQVFSAKCIAENTPEVLGILCKIIYDLKLSESEIEAEKENIFIELHDADNDPKKVVFDYLHETAFQGTPLGFPVIGPSTNILKFNRNMVVKYMRDNYVPSKLIIAASGGIFHRDLARYAQMNIGCIPSPDCSEKRIPSRFTGSQIIYRDDSMPFAHVAISVEVPGYSSSEYLKLLIASCVIGSWDKSQGGSDRHGWPLARAAATSDLCESFKSFYFPYRDVGLWGIYFVGNLHDLDDMLINVQERWMHLCISTVDSDLQRAVNLAKMYLTKKVMGSSNSSFDIGLQIMYNSKGKSLSDIYAELSLVTVQDIKQIADKYLYDQCPAVAAVGPTEGLPEYNRIRSGMYWCRL